MKSMAKIKKSKLVEQYVKNDVTAKPISNTMSDTGSVVKPNNGRGKLSKLRKK